MAQGPASTTRAVGSWSGAWKLSAERKALNGAPSWLKPATQGAVWLAILSTVYSGAEYVQTAARLLRGKSAS